MRKVLFSCVFSYWGSPTVRNVMSSKASNASLYSASGRAFRNKDFAKYLSILFLLKLQNPVQNSDDSNQMENDEELIAGE